MRSSINLKSPINNYRPNTRISPSGVWRISKVKTLTEMLESSTHYKRRITIEESELQKAIMEIVMIMERKVRMLIWINCQLKRRKKAKSTIKFPSQLTI